jgi:hypothetical protein
MDTQKVEIRAFSDDHLDAVSGGIIAMGLANTIMQVVATTGGGGGGGRGDPAQMFQQLLQQLTQGQG